MERYHLGPAPAEESCVQLGRDDYENQAKAECRQYIAATRNHRCRTMDELLDLTFDWFASRTHFHIETRVYGKSP